MIEIATKIAWAHYNLPYIWGGKTALEGFDCSGFIIDILQSVGIIDRASDTTAQGLWKRFQHPGTTEPEEGCLVFYGKPDNVNHVMYCLDKRFCIGAVGGGKKCTSIEFATALDARVRVFPINYRTDIVGFADPFLAKP